MPYPVEKFGGIVYLQNIAKSAIIYPELLSGTEMPERFGKSGSLCARVYTQGGNGVDGTDMVWEVGCFENLVVAGRIFFLCVGFPREECEGLYDGWDARGKTRSLRANPAFIANCH